MGAEDGKDEGRKRRNLSPLYWLGYIVGRLKSVYHFGMYEGRQSHLNQLRDQALVEVVEIHPGTAPGDPRAAMMQHVPINPFTGRPVRPEDIN